MSAAPSGARSPQPEPLLASRSPRRGALLRAAGIAFEQGPAPDVDETPPPGLTPPEVARALAERLARVAAARAPGRVVITADTVVALGERLLGTPADAGEAREMLAALAGREHVVATGVAVARDGRLLSGVAQARVAFGSLAPEAIEAYVATGEPLDKAGAYALQGGGRAFARLLEGQEDTVVGLPIGLLVDLLDQLGVPGR
jgi:septum formation protein